MKGSIEIYKDDKASIEIEVNLSEGTVWLNQGQMVSLFQKTKQNISLHIRNIFREGELEEKSVVKEYLTTAEDGKNYRIKYYNLDVIISVGYRVKSIRGTQFRIWATTKLKDLLVQGYALNEKRLAQKDQEITFLRSGIQIMGRAIEMKAQEAGLDWLDMYATGLGLLDDYDHESLDTKGISKRQAIYPSLSTYYRLVETMRKEFDSAVFGKEKDENFKGSIAQIEQGMGEEDFYPSLEEKAAMLLYLVTKTTLS